MRMSLAGIVALLSVAALADDHEVDINDWYANEYAPLWAEDARDKLDEIASHYTETIDFHSGQGAATTHDSREWVAEGIEYWLSYEWRGSDLVSYRYELVNPTTAVFYTQWLDRYAGGAEELSCGWYLASEHDGDWKITDYASILCDDYGF